MTLVLPFLNNSKDLDPFYKTDLDFWDCFGRKQNLSYNQIHMVFGYKDRFSPSLK